MKRGAPNPAGREGKPFSLYPYTFDEVVDKMLHTPPPPKHEPKLVKQRKKPAKPKRSKAG